MKGWSGYLEQIRQNPELGRDLTDEELEKLTPEQRMQLERLRFEATKE